MAITTTPTESSKKCAHSMCQCLTPKDETYCSTFCKDSKDMTTLQCDCGHPACGSTHL